MGARFDLLSQQYLPFTVLKQSNALSLNAKAKVKTVATVLTVYGIETLDDVRRILVHLRRNSTYRLRYWNVLLESLQDFFWVATVLTVYGIETIEDTIILTYNQTVATVLTVYGIETVPNTTMNQRRGGESQQYLPFTVLKLVKAHIINTYFNFKSQQYLPFTVLKLNTSKRSFAVFNCCRNSTYRLRYWNSQGQPKRSSW